MNRTLACIALAALVVSPARAGARAAPSSILYARALQHFNPRLDDQSARDFAAATLAQADRSGIDARLLVAVIAVESRWNPAARSIAGARGLGQLMPETAMRLGVDPDDPIQNISGAARQLRMLIERFAQGPPALQYVLALAAYNAGSGAVRRFGGVPPYAQTRAYVRRVISLWYRLAGW